MLTSGTGGTAITLVMVAAALMLVPDPIRLPHRTSIEDRPPRAGFGPRWRAPLAGTCTGATFLVLSPDRWWIGVPAAVLAALAVGRRPGGRSLRRRQAYRRAVASSADLLAACLAAGMAVAPALRAVADVLRDSGSSPAAARGAAGRSPGVQDATSGTTPTGDRLDASDLSEDDSPVTVLESVAAMLSLGADAQTAWRAADSVEELAPLAAAARRSAVGGGRLAQAVVEHAAMLRADDAASDLRAAGRAGVLMTAPLGVCFLPAFLCLGLAPVVIGLLGQLDIF
jgi:hypothetical protein